MTILDKQIRWRELGRLRMGDKGGKGQPQKLTTWRLTSASNELLEAAAALYGGQVQPWAGAPDEGMYELYTTAEELDVVLPPTMSPEGSPAVAYSQFYEMWSGGGCQRRCDGVTEMLKDTACLCDPEARACKITTRASVMLPRVPSVGVWRLETHGYYAAVELPGMLNLLASMAQRGQFVPATLRIEQRSVKRDGKTQRFIVPVLDMPSITLGEMLGGAQIGLTASPPALNPPVAVSREKPPIGAVAELPPEQSFQQRPDLGPVADLPDPGGAEAGEAFGPADPAPNPAPLGQDPEGVQVIGGLRIAPAPGAHEVAPEPSRLLPNQAAAIHRHRAALGLSDDDLVAVLHARFGLMLTVQELSKPQAADIVALLSKAEKDGRKVGA